MVALHSKEKIKLITEDSSSVTAAVGGKGILLAAYDADKNMLGGRTDIALHGQNRGPW